MKSKSSDFIPLGAPTFGSDDINEVIDSLESGWVGTGPKVGQFEQDFGNYVGSQSPLATNSCTAALHLSLMSIGLKPGDEVITTPNTDIPTAMTISHVGAKIIFVDVNFDTYNIDTSSFAGPGGHILQLTDA